MTLLHAARGSLARPAFPEGSTLAPHSAQSWLVLSQVPQSAARADAASAGGSGSSAARLTPQQGFPAPSRASPPPAFLTQSPAALGARPPEPQTVSSPAAAPPAARSPGPISTPAFTFPWNSAGPSDGGGAAASPANADPPPSLLRQPQQQQPPQPHVQPGPLSSAWGSEVAQLRCAGGSPASASPPQGHRALPPFLAGSAQERPPSSPPATLLYGAGSESAPSGAQETVLSAAEPFPWGGPPAAVQQSPVPAAQQPTAQPQGAAQQPVWLRSASATPVHESHASSTPPRAAQPAASAAAPAPAPFFNAASPVPVHQAPPSFVDPTGNASTQSVVRRRTPGRTDS